MNHHEKTIAPAAPDLTKRAPRSPRCRLGGYALLPRLLDKCRAAIAGSIGEYHSNCAIDKEFLSFAGVDYEALREQVSSGKGDGELLSWIRANGSAQRAAWEIGQWSDYQNHRAPEPSTEAFEYFMEVLANCGAARGDIHSWADLLDLDDYCSFGGAA